jgi:hypothetical protein
LHPRRESDGGAAFRTAHASFPPGPLATPPREVYHALLPHPALAPVPRLDDPASVEAEARSEQAWRHLVVQGALAVLLPTEDVRSAPLRALVEEILAETVLGGVVLGRLTESAVVWDLITNGINAARRQREADNRTEEGSEGRGKAGSSQLDQYGLLNEPAQVGEEGEAVAETTTKQTFARTASSLGNTFLAALNYGLLLLLALRAVVPALLAAKSLPSRTSHDGKQRAVLEMGAWSLAASLTELRERMPWLAGLLSLAQHTTVDGPAAVGRADGRLDRSVKSPYLPCTFPTLSHYVLTHGWTPAKAAIDADAISPTESRHPACAFNGRQLP